MKISNLTFEEALAELEKTVNKLESGNISLEESVKLYETGVKLSRFCTKKLDKVKQKIEIIKSDNYEKNDILADVITEN